MLYAPFTRPPPFRNGAFTPAGLNPWVVAGPCRQGTTMLDILLLALGLGGFALLAAYAAACERV